MIYIICCNLVFIGLLVALNFFVYKLTSFYKFLKLKDSILTKKKLNNGFEKFIAIRGMQLFKEDFTYLFHYKLCEIFFSNVILNLIVGFLFLVLYFYFNIILLIVTIIILVIVLVVYFIIALKIYIKTKELNKQ